MGWRSRGLNPIRVILALMSSPLRLLYLVAIGVGPSQSARSPHIVIIVADDMGWNDVSFHGSNEIPTPNIDALAYNGIILNRHYVQPLCTPSRGALLTGMYPIHLGLQGLPIFAPEPKGLPPMRILPQYLQRLGYHTHGIGKWHLGFATKEMLPTRRGFDSFLGYYNGYISYYDHIHEYYRGDQTMYGHDFRRNESNAFDLQGRYATDVFTEEAESIIRDHDARTPLFLYFSHLAVHAGNEGKLLEAPQEDIDRFRHIADPNRRTYAAMMHRMDQSVGKVTRALDEKGMLSDSIILFLSDNGAPTRGIFRNWGSNHPFRGTKATLWEGGVRSASFIWSPRLQYLSPAVSEELIHITDWLPTLYAAAGGPYYDLPHMDGFNLWDTLSVGRPSIRRRNDIGILLNIDKKSKTASIIQWPYKLVVGSFSNGTTDAYFGATPSRPIPYRYDLVSQSMAARAIASTSVKTGRLVAPPVVRERMEYLRAQATADCRDVPDDGPDPTAGGSVTCLYDLLADPCERRNLLAVSPASYSYIAQELKRELQRYDRGAVDEIQVEPDLIGADPKRFNGAWTPWLSDVGDSFDKAVSSDIPAPKPSRKPSQSVASDVNKEDDTPNTTDHGDTSDTSELDFDAE